MPETPHNHNRPANGGCHELVLDSFEEIGIALAIGARPRGARLLSDRVYIEFEASLNLSSVLEQYRSGVGPILSAVDLMAGLQRGKSLVFAARRREGVF